MGHLKALRRTMVGTVARGTQIVAIGVLVAGSLSTVVLPAAATPAADITLSSSTIDENSPAQSVVGTLVATPLHPQDVHPNPYDKMAFCSGFDPVLNLPTQTLRDHHSDYWTMYDTPKTIDGVTYTKHATFFSDPPELQVALPLNPPDSTGTYSIARAFGHQLNQLSELLRVSGDPRALAELLHWSGEVRQHLGDWDGRGYEYFRYHNPSGENAHFVNTDTNWLDEAMLAGNLAVLADAFHQNRDCDPVYAQEADFWFSYLDENWVPKWLHRTTYNNAFGCGAYVPSAGLGLQNTVGWTGSVNPAHDDTTFASFSPCAPRYSDAVIPFQYPIRQYAHPLIMNMTMYKLMGDYFNEIGHNPQGTWGAMIGAGTAQEYLDAAFARHEYWYQKTTPNADGSRDWWLTMTGVDGNVVPPPDTQGKDGLRTDAYSQYVNAYINTLHWEQFGNFANDSDMESYAKVWYNPGAPTEDVYDQDNYATMSGFSDGTSDPEVGDRAFQMRDSALLGCWDSSGYLLDTTENFVINSPTSHEIGTGAGAGANVSGAWTYGSHYNALMSCELRDEYLAGNLNFDPDGYEYALVAGAGDEDNALFNVVGTQLVMSMSPDFENPADVDADNVYTVRVEADAQDGTTPHSQALTISVNDLGCGSDPNHVGCGGVDNDLDTYDITVDVDDNDPCVWDVGNFAPVSALCPDSDGDGLTDAEENITGSDAFDGCDPNPSAIPSGDCDGDGVDNGSDVCHGTPAGSIVGPDGCLAIPDLYLSATGNGFIDSVRFGDEDVLLLHDAARPLSMVHDLTQAFSVGTDLDAYTQHNGTIYFSLIAPKKIGGVIYDDSDIITWDGTPGTSGVSMYLDGSTVGLSTSGEDIDGLHIMGDGTILVSTYGTVKVPAQSGQLTAKDEDIVAYDPALGYWSLYIDASDLGLAAGGEDIAAFHVHEPTGNVFVSTVGGHAVQGVSGDSDDILLIEPDSLGAATSGLVTHYWNGDTNTAFNKNIDTLFMVFD